LFGLPSQERFVLRCRQRPATGVYPELRGLISQRTTFKPQQNFADAQWPHSNPGKAGIRAEFMLPPERAMKRGTQTADGCGFTMKLPTWCFAIVMILIMLVDRQAFAAPPIEFAPGNSVITVRVPSTTGIVTVQVGRPTTLLWQFVYSNNTQFASYQLDPYNTLLIRNTNGSAVTSPEVYELASRTWQICNNLVPIGSDYNLWRTTAQQVRDRVAQDQLITPVVEGLEFVRNTGFKAEIAIAVSAVTGGAAAPAVLQKTVADEALGYLKSSAIDGVMFGQKSQRAAAWIWGDAYVWAKDRQLEMVNELSAGVIDYDFERIASRMGAANLCSFSDTRFIPWRLDLYDVGTSIWDSIRLQTQGMVTDEAISLLGDQLDNSAMTTALESSGSTMAYVHLGQSGGKVVENLFTIDTMVEAWWAAKDSGIFGQPSLQGSPFAYFVDGIVTDCKANGTVWRYGQAIAQAPFFQKYLIETLYSPGPITNLSAQVADYTSVNLTWTAPADDMGAKGVANHEIRYSDAPIVTEDDWNKAIRLVRSTGPASIGQSMTLNTGDLQPGLRRYFAVRAVDDQGNQGPISNCPSVVVGNGVNPISLTGDSVCPNPASAVAAAHAYLITYSHGGGMFANKCNVVINGTAHPMGPVGGNIKNGLFYQYYDRTPYASGSTVLYHYEFQAGADSKRLPATGDFQLPVDSALYGNTVTPANADSVMLRTFQVWYRNPLGMPPTRSQLRLANSTPVNMRLVKGAPTVGALYEAAVWVSIYNKDYWFDFSDGTRDFRLPAAGSYSVGVTSNLDVAVIRCDMPTSAVCGQVIPVRPEIYNAGTLLAQNLYVYLKINGTETNHATIPLLIPGSGTDAAFDWTVPASDFAQTYDVRVGITPMAGETTIANNEMVFTFNVPAGEGSITGAVYDNLHVNPITGVVVQAFSGTNDASYATTDSGGHFLIDGLIAGNYTVRGQKDGQKFEVANVQVRALQYTDIGVQGLSGVASVQLTTSTTLAPQYLSCSSFDGWVGFYGYGGPNNHSGYWLMNPDGTLLHFWHDESPYPIDFTEIRPLGFSPTRHEFVFAATRHNQTTGQGFPGIYLCQYDANGNYVSMTPIVTNAPFAWYVFYPQFMPDGEHILFWQGFSGGTNGAIWQVRRDGTELQKKVDPVFKGLADENCTISRDGNYLVSLSGVYRLDLTAGTATNVWQPSQSGLGIGGGTFPTMTPDCQYVLCVGVDQTAPSGYRVFAVNPVAGSAPVQLTFDRDGDSEICVNTAGDRIFYTHFGPNTVYRTVWSRELRIPPAYISHLMFANGLGTYNGMDPITLDGSGTNNSCTAIFNLNTNALVSVKVYDCQGRLVRSLLEATNMPAGSNSVMWAANDDSDLNVDVGVYSIRFTAQSAMAPTQALFSTSAFIPVVYDSVSLGGQYGWTAFSADGESLYYVNTNSTLCRFDIAQGTNAMLPIFNVQSFDVNSNYIVCATATNATAPLNMQVFALDGTVIGTWFTGVAHNYFANYFNYPSLHPSRLEFLFGDWVLQNGLASCKIFKATAPSTRTAVTTSTNWECAAEYEKTGDKALYAIATGQGLSPRTIYEMNADGSSQSRLTVNPLGAILPKDIAQSDRMLFVASWATAANELWATDKSGGGNPWWLLTGLATDYQYNYDVTPDGSLLAANVKGLNAHGLRLFDLPQHLNKGSIHGRVLDDAFGVGLADVPIRAVQGNLVGSATRSNSKGYFKLVNLPAGAWNVVAGGGALLETVTTNVSVAVALVAEPGNIVVTPTPSATLTDPAANSTVSPLFAVKAEPSERCAYAQFQWRRNTNDTWTSAAMLASSNQYSTVFSTTSAGWTDGSYFLRVVGVNTNGIADPNSAEVAVVYQPSSPPLTLTLDTTGGDTNLFALRTAKPAASNDLAVLVYEVKYGGDTNWLELGTTLSTNAADKQFNAALVPLGVATQYRVKNYDSVGNVSTSSVVTLTRTIPGDSDSDGIPDWWMIKYFGHPTGQAGDHSLAGDNPAGDGLSNLQKYLLGRNPLIWDDLHFVSCESLSDGRFNLAIFGQVGSNYTLQASTDLVKWASVLNFTCTNSPTIVVDPGAKYFGWRFYRVAQGTLPVMVRLNLNTPAAWTVNGLGLNLEGPLGFNYTIQVSSNLVNWQAFTNFVGSNSPLNFSDPSAKNFKQRFYRAVMP